MKVYISGAITNNPNYMQDFQQAEEKLLKAGYETVNPTKIVPYDENKTWKDYMKEDIKVLVDCDAIFMMNGWKESKGALVEHTLAEILEMEVIYE